MRQLATWRGTVTLDLSLDWRVLAFTTALACLTAIIAGILPALAVTGVAPGDAMKESGRTIAGDRRLSIRGALVVSQIALSLVLVIGAGLFLRTFTSLSRLPLGFAPGGLTVASVTLTASAADDTARPALAARIEAAVAAAAGVRAAGLSVITPMSGGGWNDRIGGGEIVGRAPPETMTWINAVTAGVVRHDGHRADAAAAASRPPIASAARRWPSSTSRSSGASWAAGRRSGSASSPADRASDRSMKSSASSVMRSTAPCAKGWCRRCTCRSRSRSGSAGRSR